VAQQRVRLKCAAERSKKLLAQRMDSEQQPRVPLGGNLRAAVAGSRHDEEFSGYTHTHTARTYSKAERRAGMSRS